MVDLRPARFLQLKMMVILEIELGKATRLKYKEAHEHDKVSNM